MRFHGTISDILGNSLRVRLLRVLMSSPNQGFTGRELAGLCQASPSQTNHVMEALRDSGLVRCATVGRSHVWRVSTEHVLVPYLTQIFGADEAAFSELKGRLKASLRRLPVDRAVLFGSVAQGTESPGSDVDLFVQVRSERDKESVADALTEVGAEFARRFGNPLSVLVLTRNEVQHPSNPKLIRSIEEEGIPVED